MNRRIPESPEHVSDAWLTVALRRSGVLHRAIVTAHTTELLEMQGAAAVVSRLGLQYDVAEAAAPQSLVAKVASPHGPIRSLMNHLGGYLREVEFYRQFGADPGIPTPECYYADIDPASGAFVLLLEDMHDCRLGGTEAATLADVEEAVRHLAPFHAKWWKNPRLGGLEFLRPPGSATDRAFMALVRPALAAALQATIERFGSAFPGVLVAAATHLLDNFDAWTGNRMRRFHESGTLVHGDYHMRQIFFPTERGGRFAVFDWQTMNAGNGGDDLARIVTMGLSVEEREAEGERLIDLYRSLLVEHGVSGFSDEQCREGFRQGLLVSAGINILAAPSIDPKFIKEFDESHDVGFADLMFGRVAAAIEAHDVLALISEHV